MRIPDAKELCHERLGDDFAAALSQYDTQRRVEVLIDEFLQSRGVAGKAALDVGCGLGFFSKRLVELGADVLACDLGETLVARTAEFAGCPAVQADCLELAEQFGPESFDLVVSSECIEHTPSPSRAIEQMAAVLKPGGWLSLSTPNWVWLPVVKAATSLRLRPFDGLELFSSWGSLRKTFHAAGLDVVEERGLHLFPFQLGCHGLSRWIDTHGQWTRGLMINLCILGQKRP